CRRSRTWLPWEIEALKDVATQIGSAIAQADLYGQVRQLNSELESQVAHRTKQLQQALDFEATLKRITDRVRDSLDETQILQTAVEELTGALGARGSNTALYDLEQEISTIFYEHNQSLPSAQGKVAQMKAFPEVYHQLLAGQYFQFCSIKPHPNRGYVSMLACPIRDDRGVLGDLWLINAEDYGFEDPEIRLVQQVANQCAIAIRQARLYQESQAQVKELERLNHLKDDFLSTVSHELRTPVTSMRVALQLLGVTLNQEFDLNSELLKPKTSQNRLARYYQVLKEECEREISLINDLLDLQRLDGGNHPINPQSIDIESWLKGIANTFQERAQSRTQSLMIELPETLPRLISDQASLERVFAELLNNACKYTPPGERITVAAIATGGEELKITVANTGVEIPAAELPRIFDKFYRVPSTDPWKQGGTGLGLALVQKLLMHIGGEIEVTSKAKKTSFTVTLPLSMWTVGNRE
ncbi:MAG: ATP-binding protein, partial [Cyanobacteria bacterium J06559_3]